MSYFREKNIGPELYLLQKDLKDNFTHKQLAIMAKHYGISTLLNKDGLIMNIAKANLNNAKQKAVMPPTTKSSDFNNSVLTQSKKNCMNNIEKLKQKTQEALLKIQSRYTDLYDRLENDLELDPQEFGQRIPMCANDLGNIEEYLTKAFEQLDEIMDEKLQYFEELVFDVKTVPYPSPVRTPSPTPTPTPSPEIPTPSLSPEIPTPTPTPSPVQTPTPKYELPTPTPSQTPTPKYELPTPTPSQTPTPKYELPTPTPSQTPTPKYELPTPTPTPTPSPKPQTPGLSMSPLALQPPPPSLDISQTPLSSIESCESDQDCEEAQQEGLLSGLHPRQKVICVTKRDGTTGCTFKA